jgi:hypothetical protein
MIINPLRITSSTPVIRACEMTYKPEYTASLNIRQLPLSHPGNYTKSPRKLRKCSRCELVKGKGKGKGKRKFTLEQTTKAQWRVEI